MGIATLELFIAMTQKSMIFCHLQYMAYFFLSHMNVFIV